MLALPIFMFPEEREKTPDTGRRSLDCRSYKIDGKCRKQRRSTHNDNDDAPT
jgi:hypothetical protein